MTTTNNTKPSAKSAAIAKQIASLQADIARLNDELLYGSSCELTQTMSDLVAAEAALSKARRAARVAR